MSVTQMLGQLFGNEPFFGGNTFGMQGDIRRHLFMISTVCKAAKPDQPLRLLEIGSWIGASALSFSQAIATYVPMGGEITCVDPWEVYNSDTDNAKGGVYGGMSAALQSDLAYNLFLHNTKCPPKNVRINHIRSHAANLYEKLNRNYFDIIYIDGSHYYDAVLKDIKGCAPLLKDQGFLCGDDLEIQIPDFDLQSAKTNASVDYVADPKSGRFFHPGVALAAAEFFERAVTNYIGYWVVRKNGDSFEDVDLNGSSTFIPLHFPDQAKEICQHLVDNWNR
jgi:hypothetical protein